MKLREMPKRQCLIETDRMIISTWQKSDHYLAYLFWGNPEVSQTMTQFAYNKQNIDDILENEIVNYLENKVQYFPIFLKDNETFIGICGLHPYKNQYEFKIKLLSTYWHRGYGQEVGEAIVNYAFSRLNAKYIFSSRNPKDYYAAFVLDKLGFEQGRNVYYAPTDKMHYTYVLNNEKIN
jgi:RimJ/RimL family protein N-acetyltransferase